MAGGSAVLKATSFGAMLRLLRRRARLTQMELGIQVGYSEAQISRLESGQRAPDPVIVATRFIPALLLEGDPEAAARLVEFADGASGGKLHELNYKTLSAGAYEQLDEIGVLEAIPAAPTFEVDRAQDLLRLISLIEGQRAVALVGIPGVGKTTLAARVARNWNRPVFWLTFNSTLASPIDVLLRQLSLFLLLQGHSQLGFILGSTAPAPAVDQQVNAVASTLAVQPCLLCFDDVHNLKDGHAWDVLRQWMKIDGVDWLFISREELASIGIPQLCLDGLELHEGKLLVEHLLDDLEPELNHHLHALTAGNPMMMRLALGQIQANVSRAPTILDDLAAEPAISVYILDTLLKDLDPGTHQLLAWLSLFRYPLDLYHPDVGRCLQALLPSGDQITAAIDEAGRRQLVDHPRRAALHPLIRSHFRHRLAAEPDARRRLHMLAAECCLTRAIADVVEAIQHMAQAGEFDTVVTWSNDHLEDLRNRGQALDVTVVVDEILDTLPREPVDLRRRLLMLLGDLLVNTARAEEAEQSYRQALDLSPLAEIGPEIWSQRALRLVNCLFQRTKVGEAIILLEAALDTIGEGSPLICAQLSASMARAQLMTSQLEESEQSARKVLEMIGEIEKSEPRASAELAAAAHSGLAIVLRIRRDYPAAIDHFHWAIREARRAGLAGIEFRTLANLAGVFYEQGDLDLALETCAEARMGLTALGDSYALARVLNTMSLLHHVRAELPEALARTEEACELKVLIGDQQGWANSEAQRAILLLHLGRVEEGLTAIEGVIQLTKDTGEQRAQAIYLDTLGFALTLAGRAAPAQHTLAEALDSPAAREDARLRGNLENHLAQAYLSQNLILEAQALAGLPAPAGAGPDVEIERDLVRVMLHHLNGEEQEADQRVAAIVERAEQSGYKLQAMLARQLSGVEFHESSGLDLVRRGWFLA